MSQRPLLTRIYRAAIEAVEGEAASFRSLCENPPGEGPFWLLGAGKAVTAMARGARRALGSRLQGGEVVTKDGHALDVEGIRVVEAAHPIPDERSLAAAERALQCAARLEDPMQLLVLISGGASSLWTAPARGLDLGAKRRAVELLMRAGVDIGALNTVRKHLSRIKGGGLLRASRVPTLTLAISDVAGDRADWIGSGPTVEDPSRPEDALLVLREAGLETEVPDVVRRHLMHSGARDQDCPHPAVEFRLVGTLENALSAAEKAAHSEPLTVERFGPGLFGNVDELAPALAREAQRARERGVDLLLAGGEPTLTLRGSGRGGRAQQLAMTFAQAMSKNLDYEALFAGTDGTDGPTEAAGAFVDARTLTRARAQGLDPGDSLLRNDVYPLLDALGDLFRTGPTQTNVTDLALIHLRASASSVG